MGARGAAVSTAAIGLLVAASGCGGGSSTSDAERVSCRTNMIDRANAAVVQRYYAQGKLGSRSTVESELGSLGPRFFKGDGSMVPYARLNRSLQGDFNDWMYGNSRVQRVTGGAQRTATQEARARADRDC